MIPKVKRQELHKGSSLFPGVRGAKQECQPSMSNPGKPRGMFVKAALKGHLEMSHAGARQPMGISDREVGCPK